MALLSRRLFAGARFVNHMHDQFVVARAYVAGDIVAENPGGDVRDGDCLFVLPCSSYRLQKDNNRYSENHYMNLRLCSGTLGYNTRYAVLIPAGNEEVRCRVSSLHSE